MEYLPFLFATTHIGLSRCRRKVARQAKVKFAHRLTEAWGLEDRCATLPPSLPPSLTAFLRRNFFPGKASRVDCLLGESTPASQFIGSICIPSSTGARAARASPSEGVPMEVGRCLLLIGLFRDCKKGKCAVPKPLSTSQAASQLTSLQQENSKLECEAHIKRKEGDRRSLEGHLSQH